MRSDDNDANLDPAQESGPADAAERRGDRKGPGDAGSALGHGAANAAVPTLGAAGAGEPGAAEDDLLR